MELNKAVLDCMQSLRRRLREELSVDIRLSQPDAVEAMLLACLRSSDQDTRNLGIRLAELSDFQQAAAQPAAAQASRQYRGHELPEHAAPATAPALAPMAPPLKVRCWVSDIPEQPARPIPMLKIMMRIIFFKVFSYAMNEKTRFCP